MQSPRRDNNRLHRQLPQLISLLEGCNPGNAEQTDLIERVFLTPLRVSHRQDTLLTVATLIFMPANRTMIRSLILTRRW